jgi:hypothetical protein
MCNKVRIHTEKCKRVDEGSLIVNVIPSCFRNYGSAAAAVPAKDIAKPSY